MNFTVRYLKQIRWFLLNILTLNLILHSHAWANNKELKIGISQEFENLNPLIASMTATNYLYRMAGRAMLTLGTDGKLYPQLAAEIPTFANGKAKFVEVKGVKKIEAEWVIKENAKWGDGTPVTCADFAFSIEVASSPNVAIAEKESYTLIEKITWPQDQPKKCTFLHVKTPWNQEKILTFYPLPKHLEGPIFNKYKNQKEGYEKNSLYVKKPTEKGLYNGPFLVSEVQLGSHVAFTQNPLFYGEKPKFEKVVVKVIANTATLEANLRSGTIDKIGSLGLSFDQAVSFEKKVKAENLPYEVVFKPSITYEHIDLNLDNPILKDIRVRQALVFAINREDLTKALFENKQEVALHFTSPLDPWFTRDPKIVSLYPYSKRKAAKLLDESGWVLNKADGFRYKDGKKLQLSIMTTAGNKTRELVQQYLKEQWKQVGIDMEIKNEPARVFFGETTSKRKYPALAMYAWMSSPEESPKSSLHSKNIPTSKNSFSGQNYPGWSNPVVDNNLDLLDNEFDAAKRLELIHGVIKEYTREVPVIPLYYRSDVAVIPKKLKNFKLPGHQFIETNEIERWSLE